MVDGVVVAFLPPLHHRAEIHRHDVEADADVRELVAHELHSLLRLGQPDLHQHAEPDGMAGCVLAYAVLIAIEQAQAVQQRRGASRIVGRRRNPRGLPVLVGRRHRERRRIRRAEVHRVGEPLPLNGERDRLPEVVLQQETA